MFDCIIKFKQAINESRYYEAHEYLEEWWFPRRKTKTAEVLFVKGLINCAVSFELHKKQRFKNANIVWKNYLKYKPLLEQFESEYKEEYIAIIPFVEDKAKQKDIY